MLVGDYFPELKDEDCEMWVFRTKNHTYLWWRYTIPWRRSGFRTVRPEDVRFRAFWQIFSEQINALLSLMSWVCGMVVRRDGAVFMAWNNLCDNFRETIGLFPFTVNGGDVMYKKRWILLIVYWWLVEMNRHNATPDNLCPEDKALRPKANQGPRITLTDQTCDLVLLKRKDIFECNLI